VGVSLQFEPQVHTFTCWNVKEQLHNFIFVHATRRNSFSNVTLSELKLKKKFFCSTLSEFENILLCERILKNVTTCRFGAFKGSVEQKKTSYSTRSCKLSSLWHSWGFKTLLSLVHSCDKESNLHTNSLNNM
jgi:hypothetical protein